MDRDDVSRPRHSRTGAKRPDEIKGEIFGPWSDGLLHRVTVTLPLRVACLDLDGTLLPKTSVSLFLADALGRTMALIGQIRTVVCWYDACAGMEIP
jgi:hypothetical protein